MSLLIQSLINNTSTMVSHHYNYSSITTVHCKILMGRIFDGFFLSVTRKILTIAPHKEYPSSLSPVSYMTGFVFISQISKTLLIFIMTSMRKILMNRMTCNLSKFSCSKGGHCTCMCSVKIVLNCK